jgi:hypothetical protein
MSIKQHQFIEIAWHVAVPLTAGFLLFFIPKNLLPEGTWQDFLPQGLLAYSLVSLIRVLWRDQVPNSWWIVLMLALLTWGSLQAFLFSSSPTLNMNELITCLVFASPVYFQQLNNLAKLGKAI